MREGGLAHKARAELERAGPNPLVGEDVVLGAAQRWVAELKQVSVGTEHLLLALIGSGGAAGQWLQEAGVREAEARATTERLFQTVQRRSGEVARPQH